MNILGITAFFHDSAACLIQDGKLVAFAEEERFDRQKRTPFYPRNAVEFCLKQGGISINEIDHVGYYVDPRQYIMRNVWLAIRNFPASLALLKSGAAYLPLSERLWNMTHLKRIIAREHGANRDARFRIHYIPHHLAHAAAAYFVSPFDDAAIITIDAACDSQSTSVLRGEGGQLLEFGRAGNLSTFPHTLAGFYTAFTQFLGFRVGTDEYKVMGLAAFGQPEFRKQMERVVQIDREGKLRLSLDYFNFHTAGVNKFYSKKMETIFGPARKPDAPITERHHNIAASIQYVLEERVLEIAEYAARLSPSANLCLGGGVALNCLMNKRLVEAGPFENVYIMPVANDAGCSIGAAFYIYNQLLKKPKTFMLEHVYLGPEYSDTDYRSALEKNNLIWRRSENIFEETARLLSEGNIVGWFQGRMEGGPRALGNRSMLADPRKSSMQEKINLRIKNREYFRPFAPSILEEHVDDYFFRKTSTPYMIVVSDVKEDKKTRIPAVVHADGTARPQVVCKKTNLRYHKLISEFYQITGVPVLLNTSFNESEPIVCSPDDAINCYLRVGLDVLVLGDYIVVREK